MLMSAVTARMAVISFAVTVLDHMYVSAILVIDWLLMVSLATVCTFHQLNLMLKRRAR